MINAASYENRNLCRELAVTMNYRGKMSGRRSSHFAQTEDDIGTFITYEDGEGRSEVKKALLLNESRRRTIYVPSEDTTILTIHPRMIRDVTNAPVKPVPASRSKNPGGKGQSNGGNPGIQRSRRNVLASAPRRGPLQPTIDTPQESWDCQGRPGSGPGKENQAPHTKAIPESRKALGIIKAKNENLRVPTQITHKATKDIVSPMSDSLAKRTRANPPSSRLLQGARPLKRLHKIANIPYLGVSGRSAPNRMSNVLLESFPKGQAMLPTDGRVRRQSSRSKAPLVVQGKSKVKAIYPPLQEDRCRPELLVEAWMSNQESALSQLLNALLEAANAKEPCQMVCYEERKSVLLQLYQNPSTVLLFKRLQGSIEFGALSLPDRSIQEMSRLKNDVGFRREFINIWTKSFDLQILRATAETVIGREVFANSSSMSQEVGNSPSATEPLKRSLENFIDVYLLRNEDTAPPDKQSSLSPSVWSSIWCWRRTMLRSLMIVYLLDRSKELKLIYGNIFQRTSDFKSTQAILREISRLLLPSVGNVTRPLARLGFHGSHVQYLLNDYDYRIDNLATQFRDGVRFTRLVEVLLYPLENFVCHDGDATVTLPTGEILTTSSSEQRSWVLSQHLKFPCPTRSQKVYNMQLALGALQGVAGIKQILNNVTAEDFVDGHREKTMCMLWGLIGRWGLSTLIDCTELSKEIRRLGTLQEDTFGRGYEIDDDDGGIFHIQDFENHAHLLKVWARKIARLHGLTVSNLTTSSADGTVFAAIIEEYEFYFPKIHPRTHKGLKGKSHLEMKLKTIGCSTCFGEHSPSLPRFNFPSRVLNTLLERQPSCISRTDQI